MTDLEELLDWARSFPRCPGGPWIVIHIWLEPGDEDILVCPTCGKNAEKCTRL